MAPHRWEGILTWGGSLPGSPEGDGGGGAGDLRPPAARPFLEVRALYQSGMPVDDANTQRSGAYALLDLRGGVAGWRVLGVAWSPFLGVTNLLDRDYVASVVVNAFGGRFFEPGPGRGAYLGVTAALGG